MTKISSKTAYPKKKPISSDYFVGTDSEDFNKTVNFGFEEVAGLVNDLNGTPILNYVFSTSPYLSTEVLLEGRFLSDENELSTPSLTKLYINKFNNSGDNLQELYLFLQTNATDFYLKLRNSNNQNNAVYFDIASIEDFPDYFILNIAVFKENEFLPLLESLNVYFFDFELKATSAGNSDPLKLDKSTFNGNAADLDERLVVLENQTDLDNAFIIKPTFSLAANVLTIGALGRWRLNGVAYTNPAPVPFLIPFCATGKTRLDYFVPNASNGFTKVSGVETLGIAIAPTLPNEDLFVTYLLVSDSGVGEPTTPPKKLTPTIDQVLRVGNATTNFIWFWNTLNSKCTRFASDHILFQKLESVFNFIRADNTTQSYNIQLPNKIGGAEQTFAMVSDLTKANVELGNVDNTSDVNKPVSTAQQAALDLKLDASSYNQHFKGVYLTEAALIAAHPTGVAGDSAQVNEVGATDVVNYSWDAEESIWVNNGTGGSGAVNTDALLEGSTNLYWTVARFLANLTYANVISALGFTPSTAPNNAQKNSDITKAEIEAKLVGEITTHTHQRTDTISLSMSDTSTALVTGDTDPMNAPYNFTLVNYWVGVKTAPTISSITVDVKKNGVSITSTKAGIDATEKTSLTGTTPVLTTTTFVKGDEITPNISTVGSGESGKALKLYLEIIKT